jgi:acyl-CoA synthetase (AMP-forming)/AMP-acid ligase II
MGTTPSTVAAHCARRFAQRPCMVHGQRRWTFGEFWRQVEALASGLAARLPQGARVGLFMANRAEYMLLQFALERAGLVRVPLNMRFTRHEAATILADCEAAAVFYDGATVDRADALAGEFDGLWFCRVDGEAARGGPPWPALAASEGILPDFTLPEALCSINYTSGTSGVPKGVMLTHRNWSALTRNMLIDRDMRRDDRVGHVGPLTHASGTYFVPWFLRGACNVIVEGGTVDGLLEAIGRESITVFTCVPTVLTRIVNHPRLAEYDLSSLRAIGYGAEPIPFNTLEKALARFGPILTQNYGLTEAMMTVTTLAPDDHFVLDEASGQRLPRSGCIGRPYTFVEVVLRDDQGRPVPVDEIGEITIRSEHMTMGYWKRPEETARVLREGWLWTGDLARCDAQGFITMAGRGKDMLISGGFNIYPAELEAVLTNHPQVVEAAVFGVPDPDWGEIAVAFVVGAPGARPSAKDLLDHCKPLLGLRAPRRFAFVDSLPKNANGKVDKPKLKATAFETFAGSQHVPA